jgi:hypothetical protein
MVREVSAALLVFMGAVPFKSFNRCDPFKMFNSEDDALTLENTIVWQKNDIAWSDPVNSDFNRL